MSERERENASSRLHDTLIQFRPECLPSSASLAPSPASDRQHAPGASRDSDDGGRPVLSLPPFPSPSLLRQTVRQTVREREEKRGNLIQFISLVSLSVPLCVSARVSRDARCTCPGSVTHPTTTTAPALDPLLQLKVTAAAAAAVVPVMASCEERLASPGGDVSCRHFNFHPFPVVDGMSRTSCSLERSSLPPPVAPSPLPDAACTTPAAGDRVGDKGVVTRKRAAAVFAGRKSSGGEEDDNKDH